MRSNIIGRALYQVKSNQFLKVVVLSWSLPRLAKVITKCQRDRHDQAGSASVKRNRYDVTDTLQAVGLLNYSLLFKALVQCESLGDMITVSFISESYYTASRASFIKDRHQACDKG